MQKATFEIVVTMATVSIASQRNMYRKLPNKILGKAMKFQLLTAMHYKVIHKNIPGGVDSAPPPPHPPAG